MPLGAWAVDYPIVVAGVQVTDANAGNVLGDGETATVVFTPAGDAPATLTLNGATLGGAIVLQSGLDDLTIHLLGENKIQGPDYQNPLANGIKRENGTTTGTLTFTTADGASGTLFFPYVTTPIEGFSNIVYNNGLEWGCDSYVEDNKVCTNFYQGVGTNVVLAALSWQHCITKTQTTVSLTGGGTITFREDNSLGRVLTLSGFTDCNTSLWWYSHSDVKFEISGTNSFTFSQGNPMLVGNDQSNVSFIATGTSAATLRFWHKGTGANRLYLTEPFISGFKNSANPGLGEGLYNVDLVDTRRDPDINDNTDYTEHYITTEAYDLKVSAVRVHNLDGVFKGHKDHIMGEIEDDVFDTSVTFAPGSSTLTLNEASITHTEEENAIISSLSTPLYVHLLGENTLNSQSYLPFEGATGSNANLVFTTTTDADPGSLTLISTHADFGKTTFYTGFNEVQYPENSGSLGAKEESGNVIISQIQSYGLTIAGIPVTSQNAGGITGDNISGIVTYNADQHALTLEGATIAGSIEVTNENNLTINVIGSNSISSGEYSALKSEAQGIPGPTITFVKAGDGDCSLELHSNNVTVISTQFGGLNYTNLALVTDVEGDVSYDYQFSGLSYYDSQSQSTLPITSALITSYTTYGITVGGVAVTSLNASNITGDNIVAYQDGDYSVTYDAESNTLSLANARVASGGISSTSNAALNVSLTGSVVSSTVNGISCAGDLSISAVGTNIIFSPVVSTKDGEATLTLQNGSDADSKLTLNYQGSESGFAAVVYDGLYLSAENPRALKFSPSRQRFEESAYAWASTIIFSNAKTYELWLGATKVTEANKANILGTEEPTATFDPDENILTLNGMTLTGTGIENDGIISRLPNLTISVNGANMITCSDSCSVIRADMEGAQSLSIQKGSDGCSLTLNGSRVIRDFKTLTVTGLSWNDNNFTYQYDTSLPNFNNGYRLMKADGEEASKNYDTGFKPALYDESVETYDLWVAGVQVTSANADDITASAIVEGKISFDAAKNVLTFERATIDLENVYMGIPVASGIAALTVNLVGDNTVTPNYNAQFFAKYTGEAEAPTLTFDTEGYMDDGIYWLGSLTLNNLEEIGSVANGYEFDLEESPENVYPQDAGAATTGWKVSVNTDDVDNPYVKVWRLEVFDLWIGDGRVISSDIRGGKDNAPYYNPVTDRLVCYDNCEYPIISSMPALTVEIDGECTIAPTYSSPAISFQEREDVTSGTLTFVRADDAQSASITLTANGENNSAEPYKAIEGFSAANITVGEGLYLKSHATMAEALEATTVTIGDLTEYALIVGDVQVTDANAADVLGDGKVSFTVSGGQTAAPTYTLTLNGATITAPIKVGLANLIFDIQGNNTITTSETCIQKMENTNPSLTFKSTSDIVGSLNLKNDNGGIFSDDLYGKITINEEFAMILQYYDKIYSNTYYLTNGMTYEVKLAPSYGVTVGGMQIYEGNAADVIGEGIGDGEQGGMVSFDKETSTLTLNNAQLSGIIRSSLPDLTIELIGDNSISSGGDRTLQAGVAVNMTIQSSADVKGLLSMHKGYSSSEKGNFVDDNVNLIISAPLAVISGSLTDDVAKNDYYATIGVNYGITINTNDASVVITNQNRMDVLNDGNKTVQFDGRNTLILNGANIAGIVIGATSPLNTTDGLIVHLTGNNKITNGTKAIANEGNAMPLTLTTSDVEQGELEYICTTCTLTVANSAFSGFTPIKYNDNLAASLDAEANPQVVTIVAVMEPFVTQPGEEHKNTEDGNGLGLGVDIQQAIAGLSDDAATTLLGEGVIVNKILYTLPGEADGYMVEDGGKVVALSSPMDDDDDYDDDDIYNVNKILEDIKNGTIQPGTKLGNPTFAERFHGMSFLLPAGYGEITLVVNTYESGELHVKVGSNKPVSITETTDPDTGGIGFETIKIPYALTEESYVFLYSVVPNPSSSRADDHRAPGRKETTTTGIRGLTVEGSSVQSSPEPPLTPKILDKSLVVKEGNHVIVSDPDIEGIDSDAFDDLTDDIITYIDLSQTAISDMQVNRNLSDDPFSKLSDNTFIYLPAGNSIAPGPETKNVVIGSVCDNMEMDDSAPFEVAQDFIALDAKQTRTYTIDQNATIYLPFALNAETASGLGTFYKLTGIADGKVTMTSVDETDANTPYMFKPKETKVSAKLVKVKTLTSAPSTGDDRFIGTYSQESILSTTTEQYYCFKASDGKFVHVVDQPMTVDPFRAYVKVLGEALGRSLDIDTGDDVTAIKNIKVGTEDNVYYDLSGRRVLYPKKGIYIVNGKKVILK